MVTRSFPGVKWLVRGFDLLPHLAWRSKKSKTVPLLPLWAFVAFSGVDFSKHPGRAMGTSRLLLGGKRGFFPRGEAAEA